MAPWLTLGPQIFNLAAVILAAIGCALVAHEQLALQSPKSINSNIGTMNPNSEHAMSRRLLILALAALMPFLGVAPIAAEQLGTVDEAKAMLDRAIAALKSDAASALSKFNDPSDQQFHDRDLYIFCFDVSDGKITADSSNGIAESISVR